MAAELSTDVELVAVDSLIPYSNNPKEHPDEQVKKIASSIKNYGWDQPIVVDGDGEIIKGHGRMQAAELLGLDEVPVIRREDLTDAEARASRIADNRTAESPWDDDLLSTEVGVLDEKQSIGVDSLGFDDNEIDDILENVPDFGAVDGHSQPGLDEKSNEDSWDGHGDMVDCPECGHSFVPTDED